MLWACPQTLCFSAPKGRTFMYKTLEIPVGGIHSVQWYMNFCRQISHCLIVYAGYSEGNT